MKREVARQMDDVPQVNVVGPFDLSGVLIRSHYVVCTVDFVSEVWMFKVLPDREESLRSSVQLNLLRSHSDLSPLF